MGDPLGDTDGVIDGVGDIEGDTLGVLLVVGAADGLLDGDIEAVSLAIAPVDVSFAVLLTDDPRLPVVPLVTLPATPTQSLEAELLDLGHVVLFPVAAPELEDVSLAVALAANKTREPRCVAFPPCT